MVRLAQAMKGNASFDRSNPPEEEPDLLLPVRGREPPEDAIVADWAKAEAGHTARLAIVAERFGALDERLGRGQEGWRHRLALIEAADLSWITGDRIPLDRLALWSALRLPSTQDDRHALARAGWAVRRLTGGPGLLNGLPEFLGRHDPGTDDAEDDSFTDRAERWLTLMEAGRGLHPITRARMGLHSW